MSPWEDAGVAKLYPEPQEIPSRFRVDPRRHRPRWLVDGAVVPFLGAARPVASRVATRSPAGLTSTALGEEALLTAADAQCALEAARRAWSGGEGPWPTMSIDARADAVARFARAVETHTDEVATLLMWEIGKSWPSARDEVTRSVEYIRNTLSELATLREEERRPQIGTAGGTTHQARTHRRPLGKVLCVAPFNYPVNEFLTTVIPALLMGNVVLAKTPRYGVLANLVLAEAFRDCFPPGTVALMPGEGRVVLPALMSSTEKDIAQNPVGAIDVFAFIGSEGAANAILRSHPVPITLHKILGLGAKNAAVVLEGANLEAATAALVKGALGFNGQRCTAEKLVFVEESVADEFVSRLAARVEDLTLGMPWVDGVQVTPLPEDSKLAAMREYLDDALARGARVANATGGRGVFSLMRPAVVCWVKEGMRLYHEEQFGPLLAIARFSDADEVLEWQRRSPFGQQAAVWGPLSSAAPLVRQLGRFVARVNYNDVCQRGPDSFGFTATDKSGFGVLSLREAILSFSRPVLVQSPDAAALETLAS